MGHDFLSVYSAKLLEYGLAIGYLLLFIPFWSYVQGGKKAAAKGAAAAKHARTPARAAGFTDKNSTLSFTVIALAGAPQSHIRSSCDQPSPYRW